MEAINMFTNSPVLRIILDIIILCYASSFAGYYVLRAVDNVIQFNPAEVNQLVISDTPDCKDSDYSHSVYSTSSYLPDASFLHCRDKNRDKKSTAPESKVEEGSSKRNIVRKSDHDPNRKEKKQGGGGGGKGNWDPIADGSL
eukprot:scaffold3045_cov271-Chaetoceros_neogracile.AAC.13